KVSTAIATPVTAIATSGVRCRACVCANTAGSWPSRAIANSSRGAASTSPLSVPLIEMSAPTTITAAPKLPAKACAASASGRLESASPGKVPTLTNCTPTYTGTITASATRIANGRLRRGSRTSPAGTVAVSKPVNANTSSSIPAEKSSKDGVSCGASRAGSTNHRPTSTNRTSGTSLPTVNTLATIAAGRTPRMLTQTIVAVTASTSPRRQPGEVAAGQKCARYCSSRLHSAANAVTRVSHTSQPTWKPTTGPKASCAYR